MLCLFGLFVGDASHKNIEHFEVLNSQYLGLCWMVNLSHLNCEFWIILVFIWMEKKYKNTCYIFIPTNYCILASISFEKTFISILAFGISWNIYNILVLGGKIIIPTFLVFKISRPYNTYVGLVYLKSDTNTTLERTKDSLGTSF